MLEKIFGKLNKIPSWVSVIALAIGVVVASVPVILHGDGLITEITELLQTVAPANTVPNVNGGFVYLVAVLDALISYLIIEFCAHFVFQWAVNSRYTNRGKQYYTTVVRYAFALINLVIGLYDIIGVYVSNVVYSYVGIAFLFVLRTAVVTFVYLGIRKECINDKFVFNCYNRLYIIYFMYNAAYYLLELFLNVLSTEIDVGYAVFSGVMVGIVALSALVLYLTVFKKLKKEQEDARKIVIIPPVGGGDNTEIFKGFGM